MLFKHEKIELDYSLLKESPWRATHVLKPDLELLKQSILDYGILSPVIVHKKTMQIIDGYHRWLVFRSNKELIKKNNSKIEVLLYDIDEIDAMMMHLRLNRGRGSIFANRMSMIIKDIDYSGKYSVDEMQDLLSMNVMEIEMMLDGSLLKSRKVKDHTYSKAWVPIEVPSGKVEKAQLERPPNADR
jgi:ParB-like chromosome segregation protein Spo0J